jgi:hypothetical protein
VVEEVKLTPKERKRKLHELLNEYYKIFSKYCMKQKSYPGGLIVCKIKNPYTEFAAEVFHESLSLTLSETGKIGDCNQAFVIFSEFREPITYFGYCKKGDIEFELKIDRLDEDFKLENFENTLKNILHFPSYTKYKIKTLAKEIL